VSALPKSAEDLPSACDALQQEGRLDEALVMAREILAQQPERPAAHLRVGSILLRQGQEAAAWEVFTRATVLTRPSAPILSQLGQIAARRGEHAAATEYFTEAVRLEPGNVPHLIRLSDSLARQGDYAGAITHQREAVRLVPGHESLRARLAALLEKAGPEFGAPEPEPEPVPEPAPTPVPAKVPEAEADAPPVVAPAPPAGSQKTALQGADGFLFHEVDYAFQQICQGYGSDAEVQRQLTLWQLRHDWCAARGIAYRVLIVPEKHAIYAEHLPQGWALDDNRMAARLIRGLDAPLQGAVVYPLAEIRAGGGVHQLCFRQDVHWTSYAAFLAYRALIATIPELLPEAMREDEFTLSTRRAVGDIAFWMGLRTREECEVVVPPPVPRRLVFSTKSFATGQVDVIETDHPGGRRLVMFRTSNSSALIPMLARHFSRIVAVATTTVTFELLRSERPDVVISELPERYLAIPAGPLSSGRIRMPRDMDPDAFSEITGCALPLPGAPAGVS
jgi:tetratricopeptide (TPR) repeat protein